MRRKTEDQFSVALFKKDGNLAYIKGDYKFDFIKKPIIMMLSSNIGDDVIKIIFLSNDFHNVHINDCSLTEHTQCKLDSFFFVFQLYAYTKLMFDQFFYFRRISSERGQRLTLFRGVNSPTPNR